MIVNDDTALIYGRELLAYPKKMVEIIFSEDNNAIITKIRRRGVDLASARIILGEEE